MDERLEAGEHQAAVEFIEEIRGFLGLKQLPKEPPPVGMKVTLDGVTFKTRSEWARELKVTRQCIDHRLKAIEQRKALGASDPYRRVSKYKKRQRAKRYLRRMA